MSEKLSASDIREFALYLIQCTDRQVLGVLDKERAAGREAYIELARQEAMRRGLG